MPYTQIWRWKSIK